MLQMFVICLREGIEAFLIVAIALAYLRKTGRAELAPAVFWGAGTATGLSILLGVKLAEVAVQPFWEGIVALIAVVLVTSMVIYMLRTAKNMRRRIGERLEAAAQKTRTAAWIGVFVFTVLMITREGMETAFLIDALAMQTGSQALVTGALFGLAVAALLAWAWSRYGHRVNLALFFQVTSIFLILFALQLVLYSFHEFTEANALPINNEYWHAATEAFAEGKYAQIFSLGLVVVPLAWLLLVAVTGKRRGALSSGQQASS
jgi:high-affinity iron transporter